MSYTTIRNGLDGILNTQSLVESAESSGFKDAPSAEYENTYIMTAEDGEADEQNEQQSAFLYDNQKWTIQIAFSSSGESSNEQRNAINRKRETLLSELDDPVNWRSFCTLLRYKSWKIEEFPNYFVVTIELKIKDALAY